MTNFFSWLPARWLVALLAMLGSIGPVLAQTVTMPTVVTVAPATSAIAEDQAPLGGNVTSDGGSPATLSAGVVYGPNGSVPTLGMSGSTPVYISSGVGSYSKLVSGLTASRTYAFRAFATNSAGTSYGAVRYFATRPVTPSVTVQNNVGVGNPNISASITTSTPTYALTNVGNGNVTLYVTPAGGSATSFTITTSSTSPTVVQPTPLADGTYTVYAAFTYNWSGADGTAGTITSVPQSTDYKTFTVDGTAPTVTSITSTAVTSGGTVNSTAAIPFTITLSEKVTLTTTTTVTATNGTVSALSLASTGTTLTFSVTPTAAGSVTLTIPAGAVRDLVGNPNAIISPFSFTYVAPVAPTVTTDAPVPTTISGSSAVLGGTVTSDGGATVTARGIVYSATNALPTLLNSTVSAAGTAGTGSYNQTVGGLTPGTTYNFRAYATNNTGPNNTSATNYGSVLTFTTAPGLFGTPTVYSQVGPSPSSTGRLAVLISSSAFGFSDRIFYSDPQANNIPSSSITGLTRTSVPAPALLPHTYNTNGLNYLTGVSSSGSNATGIAFGDINGDSYPDIVTANAGSNDVSIIQNNQMGFISQNVFIYSTGTGSAPQGVAIGDVDGNGQRDIITANTGNNTVSVLLKTGSLSLLTFTSAPSAPYNTASGSAPKDVALGDLDGDGRLDIVTGGSTVGVLLSSIRTSPGLFGPVATYNANTSWIAVGDVDNNGSLDIITGAGVLLNTGMGTFGSLITSGAGGAAVGDFNLDGRLDIIVADLYNGVGVKLGMGSGLFGPTTDYSVSSSSGGNVAVTKATVGDVNNDGRPDIVVAGYDGSFNTIAVLLNTAVPVSPTLTSLSASSVQVGTSITLTGVNIGGVTGVSFNGVAAPTFASVNATTVTATVPAGATSGNVTVTTSTVSNGLPFTIGSPDLVVSTTGQTIAAGTYNTIVVNSPGVATLSGNVTVNTSLTVNSGATLNDGCATISGAGSFTLAAGGALGICNGAGIASSGATGTVQVTGARSFSTDASYVYNGSAAQTTGDGLPAQVRNLSTTNASTVTLTAPTSATQVVNVGGAGNLALNGNALTLLSNSAGTALVVNSSSGVVSGSTAVVQRYIDGSLNSGPGYRHFSVPVTGTTLADFTTSGFTPVLNPAFNSSPTPATVTPFPTLYIYNQSALAARTNNLSAFDKGWLSPSSLNDGATPGIGYCVNISAGQVVDLVGTLYNTPLTVGMSRTTGTTAADGGWALLGNPYPAPLDLSLVQAADRLNLDAAAYVVQSTGQYAGGYRAYVNGVSTSPTNNPLLALGQAFFMRVSAGQPNGSFTFRNAQRVTSFANQTAFQRTASDPRPAVRLELAGAGRADGWVAYVEAGATLAFDSQLDAGKLPNSTGLNLSSLSPLGENLAIDGQPAFAASTVLPLTVGVPAAGTYTLAATALNNLPAGLDAYLRDSQTGQTILLTAGTSYSFSVTALQATALLTGRFALLFRSQSPLATVAALAATDVTVYPNPTHASFTIALPGVAGASTVQADLLNTLGQVVRRQAAALPTVGTTLTMPTADLAAGVYILRLQAGTTTLIKRVVVQ